MSKNFSLRFERDLVATALKNEDFLKKSWRIIDAHHLVSPQLQWIWGTIRESWQKFSELPASHYFVEAAKKIEDEDDRRVALLELRKLYRRKVKSPNLELEALAGFVKRVEYDNAATQLIKAVDKGNLEEAEKIFHAASKITVRPRNYTMVKWFEEFDKRQEARRYEKTHEHELRIVPTGIKRLDRIIGKGHRAGELGIVMGTTSVGKSFMLNNFGMHAVKAGFRVAYLAFEMPARQVATRFDSLWLRMAYTQFKHYEFEESELRRIKRWYRAREKTFRNKLRILSWPVRSADLTIIASALEDLRIEDDFRPDLLLFDSLDHVKAIEEKGSDYRLQQKEVYETAKAFAVAEGYAIWTSTQAGSQWANKMATAEASSESYDKSRISDTVLTINDPSVIGRKRKSVEVKEGDDEEDEEAEIIGYKKEAKPKKLALMLAKYRDGESRVRIDVIADFAKMKVKEVQHGSEEEKE